MSLQKQVVPVYFAGGLDTKTAKQLVVSGKFLVLENCVRRKEGRIEKRFGFTNLGTSIVGSVDSISQGRRLAKLDEDLLLLNDERVYSYSTANDDWVDKGKLATTLITSSPAIRNTKTQSLPDHASTHGITVVAWEDSRGGVRFSVFDDSTNAGLVYDTLANVTASRPKVIAINSVFFIIYLVGTDLRYIRIQATQPTTIPSEVVLVTNAEANRPFDVDASDPLALILYPITGGQLRLTYMNSTGALGNGANAMPPPADIGSAADFTNLTACNVFVDTELSLIYTFYYATSGTFANQLWSTAFAASFLVHDSVLVEAVANVRNIGADRIGTASAGVFYEISQASRANSFIRLATVFFDVNTANLAVTGAPAGFKRSVGITSKPFHVGGHTYITVVHDSELQSTYFVVREDGFITGKMLAGLGGGLSQDPTGALQSGIVRATTVNGQTSIVAQVVNRLVADNDGTISAENIGLQRFQFDFGGTGLYSEQLGDNLHISGGLLLNYDGASTTEHGFLLYPEEVTGMLAGGGSLSTGEYTVRVTYEWTDGFGQTHRSAPSVITTSTEFGATAGQKITLTVPTLRLTEKTGTRSNVQIVAYRSQHDLSEVLYRDVVVDNNLAVDAVTFDLTQSDAALSIQEVLYTTGGVLDNTAPPSSKSIAKFKDRIFLGGLEDANTLAFSKPFVPTEGVAFSDGFLIQVDPLGGPISALGVMDDKLIIFKKDRCYSLTGDGPLDTGAQDDFTKPQLISGDAGCTNPASIALLPTGIVFQSDKGIYLLSRSLQVSYIGAPVENFNALLVTSAVVQEDTNEVRFTTATGSALIYNYYFDQWSVFTNYISVSAINGVGGYLHLRSDGLVRKESQAYLDSGGRITMAIETSWLTLTQTPYIQGFQRLFRYAFLGDYLSNHTTKVKLAYDYENAFVETVYFNVDSGLNRSYYGEDATYGDSVVYGGNSTSSSSSVYQFSSVPRQQKCEAVKFRIEDIDTITPTGGGSFNLVALTLEMGRKSTIYKMRSSKRIGSL